MGPRTRATRLAPWLLALGGCSAETGASPLELVDFAQGRAERILLNESLDFRFSEPIDPTSVHPGSARVVDAAGRPVPGTWSVDRKQLSFVPRLARAEDLLDSGFKPGREVTVTLAGFPRIDGLRARGGAPLAGTSRFTLRTVDLTEEAVLFVDEVFGPPLPLTLEGASIGPREPLLLRAEESLDPRSVRGDDFALFTGRAGPDGSPVEIPLRARLRENSSTRAIVELWPTEPGAGGQRRTLETGDYLLVCRSSPTSILELGGSPIAAAFGATVRDGVVVSVQEGPTASSGSPIQQVAFDFFDRSDRSDAVVPESDGTALWVGDGTVTTRFPAAAGSGIHGDLVLAEGELPARLAETLSLTVPEGVFCQLTGPRVVRLAAQGALTIEGSLIRRARVGAAKVREGESAEDWYLRMLGGLASADIRSVLDVLEAGPGTVPVRLLDALTDADEAGAPWTVLVAGGDLTITGDIWVDGPLLLVAGGWVRIAGSVVASEVWTTLPCRGGALCSPRAEELPFELTQPIMNPLRRELRWSVQSRPLGLRGPFGQAEVVGTDGSGSARVRFIGESRGSDGSTQELGPVDDPSLLFDASALVFRIDLLMPAASPSRATAFELPSVDSLRFDVRGSSEDDAR